MNLKTENQMRQELAGAWDLLSVERRASTELTSEIDRLRAALTMVRGMLLCYEADPSNPGPACIRGRIDKAVGAA